MNYNNRESNSLGVVGFSLMILGWLTCGFLCVPALFFCGVAMMKEPRGLAIAGFILSIPGALVFFVFGIGFFISLVGAGAVVNEAAKIKAEQDAVKQSGGLDRLRKIPTSNKPLPASIESTVSPP